MAAVHYKWAAGAVCSGCEGEAAAAARFCSGKRVALIFPVYRMVPGHANTVA